MRTKVDVDELRRLVEVEGMTRNAASAVLGVSSRSAYRVAEQFGITSLPGPTAKLDDAEWLREQDAAGPTCNELAAELGVHPCTVSMARQRYGIAPARAPRRPIDADDVRRRFEAGQSPGDIGRALGRPTSVICAVVKRLGLR